MFIRPVPAKDPNMDAKTACASGWSKSASQDAHCPNMAITKGVQKSLEIKATEVHGFGCFAKEVIAKEEYVAEYFGEIVSRKERLKKRKKHVPMLLVVTYTFFYFYFKISHDVGYYTAFPL